ncbi:hypothetical protein ACFXP3_31680, partial [Streptomyces sp. NPDC059096]
MDGLWADGLWTDGLSGVRRARWKAPNWEPASRPEGALSGRPAGGRVRPWSAAAMVRPGGRTGSPPVVAAEGPAGDAAGRAVWDVVWDVGGAGEAAGPGAVGAARVTAGGALAGGVAAGAGRAGGGAGSRGW